MLTVRTMCRALVVLLGLVGGAGVALASPTDAQKCQSKKLAAAGR